ncbi:hypothetical protein ES676_12735 [Bizionia saleffrena]|uniref:Uncharacterized protein n=1 Tax=Bizionia saleffrena TaxID=291189 RepID=A0A8H2LAY9_9FLAO|nr:hypothetical protein [Bizionia saleffrena]TYB71526.1 hypothetical protein ES676_12735 [Bizionia saleffrena]
MERSLFTVKMLLISLSNAAQTNRVEIDTSTINSHFFIAIIAGVLLALIFQIILTALSVALGINMIGNLKKTYVENKVKPSDNEKNNDDTYNQDYDDYEAAAGVKISSAFGIWSLLTTAISLFGASAIALNLSFFGYLASNLTVALVIWALFFLLIFYLETKIVNTLIDCLVTTVTSGLKSSANIIKQLFATSDEKKIENVIGSSIDKIRKEFDVNLNTTDLSNVLDKFLTKVDDKMPNYDTLKEGLDKIAGKSKSSNSSGKYMAIQQVLTKAVDKVDTSSDNESNEKDNKLKFILSDLKNACTSKGSTAKVVTVAITKKTPVEESQINDTIKQVKEYLSKITPEAFSGAKLTDDFNKILSDPKSIGAIFSTKFADLNKDSIIETLYKNTSLDEINLRIMPIKLKKAFRT